MGRAKIFSGIITSFTNKKDAAERVKRHVDSPNKLSLWADGSRLDRSKIGGTAT